MNNFFKYSEYIFTDVWESAESFVNDYNNNGIKVVMSEKTAETLFYLLYARYGNSTLAFTDVEQFKYNVFALIFMYGPTWEERLNLQEKLRSLTDEEIMQGSLSIYNNALNPGTTPKTTDTEELSFINSQNTSKHKRSKIEAIGYKWELLATDVTEAFLSKFRSLFRKVLDPMNGVFYKTTEGEN